MNLKIHQKQHLRIQSIRTCFAIVLTLLVAHGRVALAGVIPANRLIPWSPGVTVGVPGGIPSNRTNLLDVTQAPYNADSTGSNDASVAINSAISACPSNGVVYLPAGTYMFANNITIPSYKTVRGAGSNTVVNLTGNAGFAFMGSESDYNWTYPSTNTWITNTLVQGTTSLALSNASVFAVGHIVQIQVANDTNLPAVHVSGYGGLRRQKTLITGITGNTLTIFPPIYGNYSPLACSVAMAQYQGQFIGVENLTINATNSTQPYIINMEQCYGCWVKNVHSEQAANFHIFLYDSLQCEIRDSFLDSLNHAGPNGAGLMMQTSSGCLIENNLFTSAFPLIEVYSGCCGNVFGYNFGYNSDSDGLQGAGIDSNHSPHNEFNLYEGNVFPNLQCDGYFGSTSHDTIYRNWFHGVGPASQNMRCIELNRFTRNYSIVGNILGSNGVFATALYTNNPTASYGTPYVYEFGLPNMGNGTYNGANAPPWPDWGTWPGPGGYQELDTNVYNTTIIVGNYNYLSNSIPASESLSGNTLTNSYYLTNAPDWFGNLTWPPFDPTNPRPSYSSIPAGYRYLYGVNPPSGITAPIILKSIVQPSPN